LLDVLLGSISEASLSCLAGGWYTSLYVVSKLKNINIWSIICYLEVFRFSKWRLSFWVWSHMML